MRANARRLATLAAAALCAGTLLAGCHQGGASASAGGGSATDMINAPEMTMGNPNAKVKMVEYASDTCVHCARFDADVFPAFKAKYIDTGKVYYAFREFLTPPEPVAAAGFLLARCAGRDKYFNVVEAIFRAQPEMFQSGDAHGVLLRVAQSAGLSEPQFNACEQNDTAIKALAARVQHAEDADHIDGTPTFIINGKQLPSGEKTMADLDAAVTPLLGK
jgi:protein-disulfide isomerase